MLENDENMSIINEEVAEDTALVTKNRLRDTMKLFDDTFTELAKYLGISYQSLSKKLNGHTDFRLGEVRMIQKRYCLDAKSVYYIFFQG